MVLYVPICVIIMSVNKRGELVEVMVRYKLYISYLLAK